ncbi:O-acetylhomoserine aminocarboxypropyltransferase/cysteine synthase family protein [Clavibacter phaseoli]|uniref:O-acetylhomoserine aminocarboxypropyltransferase/cysteine synthase family protein n=1 Tax=Clavibacter phaseoli TaxID=1734031 RepID=UPI000E6708C6|nr:O-acetylhomoserine aminocarboxypropyltransferase/cysteine synthase family protein [Clavibacter phaseoli]RIJ55952.1 O-acetylhomoserine aminocarboxypropyltransferase/cysteine synthase [Clavibacter phaseoli]UKF29876.1 O-acetylhomoserine aminocarboxypropyltransferase/cysteine synthase [Clavibacter phaseoli]UKF35794.1 O-acetylhomoserine aminocarboxypropyltransferase/cysteine synthase [Clavibacter phaseoli]
MVDREYGFKTRAIHAGNIPDATTGARALPIYQSSAFVFDDTADAAARFALQKYGNVYSRLSNPTVASFEERVASLEGGLGAVATASGLSAQYITFASLAGAGDHIVASANLYGGSITQLDVTLRRFGVETTFVQSSDPADYAAAITDHTKLVFAETVANPSGEIADIEGLAAVAHAAGVPLVIDSTIATPYLNRPIEWGADIVIHSATKFLGGHGTTLGGVVVESGLFDWESARFPLLDQPVPSYGGLNWTGNFGEYAFLTRLRAEQLRDIGPSLAPHSAFLLAQGVETLPYRMQAHIDNARAVAEWLDQDPRITAVNWAGLPAHPHHERARKYLPTGPGSVFTFEVAGGRAVGQRFIESVELASHLANIGDAKTLVIHPASTTHAQLSESQLVDAGVLPGIVRISVGIEDVADIIHDLDQALAAATEGAK